MKAGFIGLGAMGGPMARNVAAGGHLYGVWNRTPDKVRAFAEETGVAATASPGQLAAAVDVIFLCVSADRDVLQIIDDLLPALRPGSIVVDFSTVSLATACAAAERLRERGGDFLDAPVTGGVEGARAGTLAMMIGGSPATLDTVMPVLKTMATRILHMGEVGAGQATKAVNQVMAAGINQAVTEALAFGERLGLDMDKAIDVISGGAAGNWFLNKRGPSMIRGTFDPGFKLSLHRKDLDICLAMSKELQQALPLAAQTCADYTELMQLGFADEDISALYRLKRP